jgi:hypothetical protein
LSIGGEEESTCSRVSRGLGSTDSGLDGTALPGETLGDSTLTDAQVGAEG